MPALLAASSSFLRFRRGHRQRLVGDDVLAFGDRRRVDRIVQIVGRGVVDDLDVRVVEQRLVAAVGLRARRAPPPWLWQRPRCCRRPPRRRRTRAAAPRRRDAVRRSPAPTMPMPIRFTPASAPRASRAAYCNARGSTPRSDNFDALARSHHSAFLTGGRQSAYTDRMDNWNGWLVRWADAGLIDAATAATDPGLRNCACRDRAGCGGRFSLRSALAG